MEKTNAAGYVEDKEAIKRRLARIEGQVGGLRRMVDDEAYCVDVLTQISAVTKALEGVSLKLLTDHTNTASATRSSAVAKRPTRRSASC